MLSEARPGDVLVFKGKGQPYGVLSWLIKRFKEPQWDFWGWHMAPIVKVQREPYLQVIYIDAKFPRLKLSILKPDALVRCYRVLEQPPSEEAIQVVIDSHVGKWYDIIVYLLTGFAVLFRPRIDVPRIINLRYTCWEATWDALEYWDFDMLQIPNSDYNYPFLTDFLRGIGELK